MIDSLLSFLAPHSCLSCGGLGSLLCGKCGAELIEERVEICIGCGKAEAGGLCAACKPTWPVDRAVVFGERADVLERLINEYKFNHRRAAARELADLTGTLLPVHGKALLVPIPTIAKHIRERGYDHMALLTKRTTRRNHLVYTPILIRDGETVQYGASKQDRITQAKHAFKLVSKPDPAKMHIILDDITTTGASLKSAAKLLRDAGAQSIWVVALARQPLE